MTDRQVSAKDHCEESSTSRQVRLRLWTRWSVLLGSSLVILVASETVWPVVVTALSPFVALASLFQSRTIAWFSWLGIVILVIVSWRRRWFCRWLCPTGLCTDGASWLGKRCGRQVGHVPALGRLMALLTLSGALFGYPLLLWLDPLALFSAAFTPVISPDNNLGWWLASGMIGVLVISLLWPQMWCSRLCPLGGLQDILCELRAWGTSLRRVSSGAEPPGGRSAQGIARRTVLGALLGAASASLILRRRREAAMPLRPPGSVDEDRFTGLCVRCGNCSRACPTEIIGHASGQYGWAGLLTPRIEFRDDYCLESCNQCTLVCPSGALQAVPLSTKVLAKIGVPVVNMDLCLLGDDRECSLCRNHCPFKAIRLVFSEEEYTLTPVVSLEKCPGCGACQVVCPTQPQKAIIVVPPTPV